MVEWEIALAAVSSLTELLKNLRSPDKQMTQSELKLQIADLTTALADIKLTLTEAKAEAADKDAQIARLMNLHRRVTDNTIELYGYRYRKSTKNASQPAGNPFCDVCLQK